MSILAYGDSLTWGARPDVMRRHAPEDRWPNVLASELGREVISEGLRGRTTAFDMHLSAGDLNGAKLLPSILHTHAPLDLVIIMLGTNDVYCSIPTRQSIRGLDRLIELVRSHPWRTEASEPAILLVAPPIVVACGENVVTHEMVAASKALTSQTMEIAREKEVSFFDAESVAKSSPLDGLHLDAANTRAIGRALTKPVKEILG